MQRRPRRFFLPAEEGRSRKQRRQTSGKDALRQTHTDAHQLDCSVDPVATAPNFPPAAGTCRCVRVFHFGEGALWFSVTIQHPEIPKLARRTIFMLTLGVKQHITGRYTTRVTAPPPRYRPRSPTSSDDQRPACTNRLSLRVTALCVFVTRKR